MSRSKRKTSVIGIAGDSDKEGKQGSHRKFRRREKDAIRREIDPPEDLDEVSDAWDFDKDGESYFDPDEHPELMRK